MKCPECNKHATFVFSCPVDTEADKDNILMGECHDGKVTCNECGQSFKWLDDIEEE